MKTAAELAVEVTSNVSKAVDGLDDVGSAAGGASSDLTALGRDSQETARKLGISAEAADDLGGKAGKATGALGALASGFELVGLDKYASGLESAAMATDFFSGIGDGLNLVMESTTVQSIRGKAATIAHAVATKATAVATKAMTAGQWALNAAMTANPIGIVVVALLALIAGLVLAYKKSASFRTIVQATGRAGREAIGWVVSKTSELVGWVKDKLPGAFTTAKAVATTQFRLMTAPPRLVIDVIRDVIGWVKDKLPGAFTTARDLVVGAVDRMLAPIRSVRDMVQSLIDKLKSIKLPNLGGLGKLNPFGRTAATGTGDWGPYDPGPTTGTGGTAISMPITVNGALDPVAVADQILALIRARLRQTGGTL